MARLRRQLTEEQVAQRSGITAEQVHWLEEGRVYAFRSPEDALAAATLLVSGLAIDNHEARELAGLPVLPRPIQRNPRGRLAVAGVLVLITVVAAMLLAFALQGKTGDVLRNEKHVSLPAPWRVKVDVLNGSGDIEYTRRVASRIAALGYTVSNVRKADRFDHTHSTVFYTSAKNGKAIGERLADELGVELLPLPRGANPLRLVYIVGPKSLAEK